jgi:hypothetical protein
MLESIGKAVIHYHTRLLPPRFLGGGAGPEVVPPSLKTFDPNIATAERTFDRGVVGTGTFR